MGSGGGSSGKSDWPDYMKTMHTAWLAEMDAIIPATNPYTGMTAYAWSSSNLETFLTNYKGYHTAIGLTLTAFKSLWSGWYSYISTTLATQATAELETTAVAAFEAGMSDINAVQTSSFVLGKAMLYARVGLQTAQLALLNANQTTKLAIDYGEALRNRFMAEMETIRMETIAGTEQVNRQAELDVLEAQWPFFNYREAGALLGAIGGPGAMNAAAKPDPMKSALGGAMAGAAAGAPFGGVGAIAGGIIGGIGGYLSAS